MFKGTLVNCAAIAAGTLVGCTAGKIFSERLRVACMQALGLSASVIGIAMALEYHRPMILLGSLVVGSMLGELCDLETRFERFSSRFTRRFAQDDAHFFPAFIQSSILYITGTMAILGPLKEGLTGDTTLLYTKAVLDGVTAIVLSSTLGIGVLFSILAVQLYQGSISLIGAALGQVFTSVMIENISAVGGVLLIAIGFNQLKLTQFRLMNLLPALLFAALFSLL